MSVSDADYPAQGSSIRAEVLQPIQFPTWTKENFANVLSNIQFKRERLWGDSVGYLFSKQEVHALADSIVEGLKKIQPTDRLVLVNRFDPDTSILSKTHMNSFLLWMDEAGLNLVFGVIHEEIPGDDFHDNTDWDAILPISMRSSFRDLEILNADFLTHKVIDGIKHRTWIIIPAATALELPFVEPQETKEDSNDETKSDENQKKESQSKQDDTDPQTRLRKLKKAQEEGLISDEEYNQLRQDILKDF